MKLYTINRRIAAMAILALLATILPVSAAVTITETDEPAAIMTFSKSGMAGEEIFFSADDFRVVGDKSTSLDSIILTSLPAREAGSLMLGDEPLFTGDVISVSALNGVRFSPLSTPQISSTSFTFTPVFTSGVTGQETGVNLYLLSEKNRAPTAENMEFATYKNVAYTGQFSAIDPEGDLITFQLVDKPARGSLVLSETNEAEFVYTPYENKTGKDSFTYIAIDSVGNTSAEATVKIQIEKPSTKVTYADMDGHPAYNAAIRLAEENIFVGASMNGTHYFQPDTPVSRAEFLAMAMTAMDADILGEVSTTGFYDDSAIQTWAKPYVASALKSGDIQGCLSADGQIVFCADNKITQTEAAVLLNRMLRVSNISTETWGGDTSLIPSWACQAVINLETVGVISETSANPARLNEAVSRADAAQMLSAALDLIKTRESSQSWFNR